MLDSSLFCAVLHSYFSLFGFIISLTLPFLPVGLAYPHGSSQGVKLIVEFAANGGKLYNQLMNTSCRQ
ncbi:MAG: hypothetical protein NVS4B7_09700 [Ktedonobacteraceae bacterium]